MGAIQKTKRSPLVAFLAEWGIFLLFMAAFLPVDTLSGILSLSMAIPWTQRFNTKKNSSC